MRGEYSYMRKRAMAGKEGMKGALRKKRQASTIFHPSKLMVRRTTNRSSSRGRNVCVSRLLRFYYFSRLLKKYNGIERKWWGERCFHKKSGSTGGYVPRAVGRLAFRLCCCCHQQRTNWNHNTHVGETILVLFLSH
jgi:hypothetical protein